MFVSSTLLVALTSLIAPATAIDGWGSLDREALVKRSGSTEAASSKSSKSSKIFEKLGFCNINTLKGRYNAFSNGNADLSGVFVGPPTVNPMDVGPESSSSSAFYGLVTPSSGGIDTFLVAVTQTFARPSKGPGALGPVIAFTTYAVVGITKNCTVIEQGLVREYTSPGSLIIPAGSSFVEGNAAPDGSDLVFTEFDTDRITAFSGDSKRVAEFALPPPEFSNGPPNVPGSCDADQSCRSRSTGADCNVDRDCQFFCFPLCDMVCGRVGIGIRKECISLPPP